MHIKHYDQARSLLSQCQRLSSQFGNSVQRVVHYFTCALQEKIDHETLQEKIDHETSNTPDTTCRKQPLYEEVTKVDPALIAVFKDLPFGQIIGLAGIQAVVESVSSFKKIHLIDLQLGLGLRCIALMQALANLNEPGQIELLKLTAIDMSPQSNIVEETGKRLSAFAETLNLPFSFRVVSVSDIELLSKDSFDLDGGEEEAVAVDSQLFMREITMKPNGFETLIRFISSLKPRIMVVKEIEAHHHGPAASNFQEVLFYYSAIFDSLECCMARDDDNRIRLESTYLRKEIRHNMDVSHMKLDQWREVFSKYGMLEKELSSSCLYQAELVSKRFACVGCCTLERNGKSFTVGWKGTPLLSVSAWEFHQEEKFAQSPISCPGNSHLHQLDYIPLKEEE